MRQNYSTGSKWEPIVGYSRAVKVGNIIEVSGTTAMKDGSLVGKNDVYLQTKQIIENIENAILALGGSLQDVVRTRVYVTNIKEWQLVGKAHGEAFGTILPTSSMIEVSGFIDPEMLVEIEATAILQD